MFTELRLLRTACLRARLRKGVCANVYRTTTAKERLRRGSIRANHGTIKRSAKSGRTSRAGFCYSPSMAIRKLLSLGVLLSSAVLLAQPPNAPLTQEQRTQLDYTLAHYTKFEYRIPMRDGVRLFAAAYVPKDNSQTYPIIMLRTPYNVGPYGADNYKTQVGPSFAAEKEGFIFVYEDVRGRYMSEGSFVDVRPHQTHYSGPKDTDESTDTYDTVDWLVKNLPNNNGKAGMWGISSRFFCSARADRFASGAEGRIPAGPHGRRG
jgi:hypothetical protein